MRKALALMTSVALSAGCGKALPGSPSRADRDICPHESLSCFAFEGTLSARGSTVTLTGWSQDLPTPGYENRWRYVLSASAWGPLRRYQAPTPSWLGGAAVVWPDGRGGMFQEAQGYWRLDMRPTDEGVASKFAALAGAQEYRAQTFQVRALPGGGAEILITEPE